MEALRAEADDRRATNELYEAQDRVTSLDKSLTEKCEAYDKLQEQHERLEELLDQTRGNTEYCRTRMEKDRDRIYRALQESAQAVGEVLDSRVRKIIYEEP